jgi:hypothetical protein
MIRYILSTLILVTMTGCALYNHTEFTEYRGPSEFQGHGGTVRTVDGIDIWQTGTPNRKYKVLGVIDQSHYDNHSLISRIASTTTDSELVKAAKAHGGDAIIILGSSSAITGYTTSVDVHGTQSGMATGYASDGNYSGTYSGSSSAYGTAYTHANTQTEKKVAVIKYED